MPSSGTDFDHITASITHSLYWLAGLVALVVCRWMTFLRALIIWHHAEGWRQ